MEIFKKLIMLFKPKKRKKSPFIADGPGMERDVRELYMGRWYCMENAMTLDIARFVLTLSQNDRVLCRCDWTLKSSDGSDDCLTSQNGDRIAGYINMRLVRSEVNKTQPEAAPGSSDNTCLILAVSDSTSPAGDRFFKVSDV